MANILHSRHRGWLVAGLVFLLHAAAIRLANRAPAGRPDRADAVQWIQALAPPARPAAAAPARGPTVRPGHAATATGRLVAPAGPVSATPPVEALPSVPEQAPAPAPAAEPALDLGPDGIGRALSRARTPGDSAPRRQWPGSTSEPFGVRTGPPRLSETTGASGSRVTRVESAWGVYCVRTPPPGRAPASGAGPETALPTNCP